MTTRVLTICISIERYTRILVSQHKLTDHQHDPKVQLSEKLYTSESSNHSSSSRSSSSSSTHASTAILIRHGLRQRSTEICAKVASCLMHPAAAVAIACAVASAQHVGDIDLLEA